MVFNSKERKKKEKTPFRSVPEKTECLRMPAVSGLGKNEMNCMRTTETTQEMSVYLVNNTRWGVKTWIKNAGATEKPDPWIKDGLWPDGFGIKSRRNSIQLINDKSNGKS
jgi:hypothetical protein